MKEIDNSSPTASVHHTRTNVQYCSNDHRPTSGTDDSRKRKNDGSNSANELAHCHWRGRLGSFCSRIFSINNWSSFSIWAVGRCG